MFCTDLEVNPYRPNLFQFQRHLLAHQLAFVPGYIFRFLLKERIHAFTPLIIGVWILYPLRQVKGRKPTVAVV